MAARLRACDSSNIASVSAREAAVAGDTRRASPGRVEWVVGGAAARAAAAAATAALAAAAAAAAAVAASAADEAAEAAADGAGAFGLRPRFGEGPTAVAGAGASAAVAFGLRSLVGVLVGSAAAGVVAAASD